MGKLQVQNGSYMVSVPPLIVEYLEAQKGTNLEFKINKKSNKIEIIKIEEDDK